MSNPDLTDAVWRKSTRSDLNGGACVEVADLRDGVAVRESKDKFGPILSFDAQGWRTFIDSLKSN
ncbi:hypothetical protein MCAG_02760 [Micromonospora sp. ATCC 39149]|uniref:DUF397 domain-containing protein n=1 Tax=Micromonospora carbonacea TaxID=47853 RepID=A0A7D5YG32_9ACTN|nr:DUF397 domain-containing protein [Micromonospora sp. ATCC 39149]EEP72433.1 hypothetical protein MCAG_02760 [Micromonospora sp. ATCC 39149]QLJ98576.1 DUF397 domain-containing protein [Micromonospora carbonacea]